MVKPQWNSFDYSVLRISLRQGTNFRVERIAQRTNLLYSKSLCGFQTSCHYQHSCRIYFYWRNDPQLARASSFTRFLDHIQDAPQSVGLPWMSDQPVSETSTWQHTTLTTNKHPCPPWDSNPQSQQANGLRTRGHWDRRTYKLLTR